MKEKQMTVTQFDLRVSRKTRQHSNMHKCMPQSFQTLKTMDEGINPFSQSKEKGQTFRMEKKRASGEKDKMRVRNRNISLWQPRPKPETKAALLHLCSSWSPQSLLSVSSTLLSSNNVTPQCDSLETHVAAPWQDASVAAEWSSSQTDWAWSVTHTHICRT